MGVWQGKPFTKGCRMKIANKLFPMWSGMVTLHAYGRAAVLTVLDLAFGLMAEAWYRLTDKGGLNGESWMTSVIGCTTCAIMGVVILVLALAL